MAPPCGHEISTLKLFCVDCGQIIEINFVAMNKTLLLPSLHSTAAPAVPLVPTWHNNSMPQAGACHNFQLLSVGVYATVVFVFSLRTYFRPPNYQNEDVNIVAVGFGSGRGCGVGSRLARLRCGSAGVCFVDWAWKEVALNKILTNSNCSTRRTIEMTISTTIAAAREDLLCV
ncbi:unnamed protein product [Ceratitis capitata]|uniref:(Mediterranean fruit fly) hypothetical protein n=1 Tax=Ceratitis capitata TaxID=7213 RepID=A0A811VC77_CERCA|nr:unnamed protein product [Ceratitis capitata]